MASAVRAFGRVSPQVRVYVGPGEEAGPLRDLGAKVASGEASDVERLATAMTGVFTACLLAPHLADPSVEERADPLGPEVPAFLRAAGMARVSRLLVVAGTSGTGRAEAIREDLEGRLEATRIPHVVLYPGPVYGPGVEWLQELARRPAASSGSIAPLLDEDLAAVLAAADDRTEVRSGAWRLEGPERVSVADLAARLRGGSRPSLRSRLTALRGGSAGASAELRAALRSRPPGELPDGAVAFGVVLTPLAEGLDRASRAPEDGG
jgi:uncharacterized protein YbjT (DUF2867 family)